LPGPYLVVADAAGEVAACGGYAVHSAAAQASFCWGMVRRDRHGLGLGRRLAEARLSLIRGDGRVNRVRLDTGQHTLGFYQRLGFRLESVRPDGYGPGMDRYDMLLKL
jgi:ribosomal protein S18 acetylase RimI-like enzyme